VLFYGYKYNLQLISNLSFIHTLTLTSNDNKNVVIAHLTGSSDLLIALFNCGPCENFCYLGHIKNPDDDDDDDNELSHNVLHYTALISIKFSILV